MGRPKYRTVTITGFTRGIDYELTGEFLDEVEGWTTTKFEPLYNYNGVWMDTKLELELTVDRGEWIDVEDLILEAGWSIG